MGDDEQFPEDQAETAEPEGEYTDPWVGQDLAGYQIIQRIGEGGMGVVYLARHQSLNRLAAVKFLGAHMVNDKAYIERFLHEARGAAKLNHPNIVSVYDAGTMGGDIYYFIMEYVEGRDLGALLREMHIFPVPDAVGYVRQAAAALGYAHKKGIIHRDVKPDNFMLTQEGIIKVGDLGLAKWTGDDSGGGMTQTGVVMGTPFYISPEQVRGARDVDPRSDVYSLGASLYHLVTSKIPYDGTSPAVIMAMHLNNPVPEPHRVNPALDRDICAIIKRMMAKKPEDRYQTMEEVDAVLVEYLSRKTHPAQGAGGGQLLSPKTEFQTVPAEGQPRLGIGTSPVIFQSEPGASLKIGFIVGFSIIIAAVIMGFFITSFLKSGGSEKNGLQQPALPRESVLSANSGKEAERAENHLTKVAISPVLENKDRSEKKRQFDIVLVTPDGGTRVLPPNMKEHLENARVLADTILLQNFEAGGGENLPEGVECFFFGSNGKEAAVNRSGLENQYGKISWSVKSDEMEPGKKYLGLLAQTGHEPEQSAMFGAKFYIPSLEANKRYMLAMLLRSAGKPLAVNVMFGSNPQDEYQHFQVDEAWRMFMLLLPPKYRIGNDNVMLGFRGAGELQIGEVRIHTKSGALLPLVPPSYYKERSKPKK